METRIKNGNNNFVENQKRNGYVLKNGSTATETNRRCKCHTSNDLHHFNCLPSHLQFNQFVHTGYRVDLSTWECLRSLFYFHNESFNVYSHGLAAIVIVLLSPYVYSKVTPLQLNPTLYPIHHITCIICMLFSAIFHLMLCHEGGDEAYGRFVILDYLGIWLFSGLSCLTFLKATFFCLPQIHFAVISIYFVMAFLNFASVMKATETITRLRPLMCLGVFRVLFLYPSRWIVTSLGYTTGQLEVVWYMLGMETVGVLGGIINISKLPERWFQGTMDYMFNSHNIMHLVVLIGPVLLHFGTVMDFEWMAKAQCPI